MLVTLVTISLSVSEGRVEATIQRDGAGFRTLGEPFLKGGGHHVEILPHLSPIHRHVGIAEKHAHEDNLSYRLFSYLQHVAVVAILPLRFEILVTLLDGLADRGHPSPPARSHDRPIDIG